MTAPAILLTGATGYIGGRLLRRFEEGGRSVSCLVRQPARLGAVAPGTEVVQGDCLEPANLDRALSGIDTAYYLVHSMAVGSRFAEVDRHAAEKFGMAAARSGVRRIVYLGGLTDGGSDLSTHLKSRAETGDILRASGVPVIEFRASIVVGAGSLSFDIIRALVERLPVMVCPRWVTTLAQPIGVDDVLAYLEAALGRPYGSHETFDIGGPEVLSYGDMMRAYATLRGLRRWLVQIPLLTPRLSSLWLALVTPAQSSIGRALVEGLRNTTVVRSSAARDAFGLVPQPFLAALQQAIDAGLPGRLKVDRRTVIVDLPSSQAFTPVRRIGGTSGWYFGNSLWRVRGWLDEWFGGVGMRRGRKDQDECRVGDHIDGWTVETYEPNRRLRLAADLALPGQGWLEYEVTPIEGGRGRITQTASFDPRGVLGRAYWYGIWPVHEIIFRGMLARIARRAEAAGLPIGQSVFTQTSIMPARADIVFAWHERPDALRDLLPPEFFVRIEQQAGGIRKGGIVVLSIGIGVLRVRWVARHVDYVAGERFTDEQVRGPFKLWRHTHRVEPIDTAHSLLIDRIQFSVYGGRPAQWLAEPILRRLLSRAFATRHRAIHASLSACAPDPVRVESHGARGKPCIYG